MMIDEEELRRQAEEIDKQIHDEEPESWGFWKLLVGVFMAIIIVLMIIPYWGLPHNPQPGPIPIITPDTNLNFTAVRMHSLTDIYDLSVSSQVRKTAILITSSACSHSDICYAKALFYFVRDDIQYLSDPPYEYIQSPEETLLGAGDCEDQAILLGMLMTSVGIHSRIVVIPRHAYVEAYLPEAPRRYRDAEGWVPLDPTCTSCGFGEIPRQNLGASRRTLPI